MIEKAISEMKIAVLLGGTSAERDVSLVTGIEIARALRRSGQTVEAIDCAFGDRRIDDLDAHIDDVIRAIPSDFESRRRELDRNLFRTIDYLLQSRFDFVFIALHGGYGENGQLQALLDLAGIPYSGSGALASGLGMDKHLSKILFEKAGVGTAPWIHLSSIDQFPHVRPQIARLGFPVVVKPNDQGSTVGLTIVRQESQLEAAVEEAFRHGNSVIAEQFIPGRELTVAVLGDRPLPVIEIIPEHGIYDYECKYQKGKSQYIVPAELPAGVTEQLQKQALAAFRALGCRHYARVDFRLNKDQQAFCLEVNTLPGMTPTSLVPKAARAVGIDFPELIEQIIRLAIR